MTTALQKQLDALFSDFTSRLTQLVREASLNDLVSERAAPAPVPVASPKVEVAPKTKPQPKVSRKEPRRRTPELPLDEMLLRHLRSGVLLTLEELLAFGPDSRKVRAAIDDLAARGLIGFSEPDRFVFAKSGRPEPSRVPAPEPTPPVAPVAVAMPEPEPEPAPESAPISTVTGEAPASAPDSRQHPFVVRRKKLAT